ncbi:MAG: hypothetical protein KAT38_08690 [Bacteroidales bacterium]|nr:hypothetical protein [Bacteroidales bacterium]
MKKLKLIATLVLLFFVTSNAFSQGDFFIHFGPSFPMSDFADDDIFNDDASGADVGLSVGVLLVYPLTKSGLGLFCGFDFNYNCLKKDVKDHIKKMLPDDANITYHKYLNYPVSAGLNYGFQADEEVSFIGNIGLTANFSNTTDYVIEADNEDYRAEFDLAKSIGFKIGAGILLKNKTSIEINYFGLGKHDLTGRIRYDGAIGKIENLFSF